MRPHSRFVDFPEHRHNYVEIMYVVQGSITHIIGGKELTLHKGDVLMLNQQVRHAIRRAEYEDIGINFIALPEFFEVPLSMLHEKNVLAEFIAGAFGQKNPDVALPAVPLKGTAAGGKSHGKYDRIHAA